MKEIEADPQLFEAWKKANAVYAPGPRYAGYALCQGAHQSLPALGRQCCVANNTVFPSLSLVLRELARGRGVAHYSLGVRGFIRREPWPL